MARIPTEDLLVEFQRRVQCHLLVPLDGASEGRLGRFRAGRAAADTQPRPGLESEGAHDERHEERPQEELAPSWGLSAQKVCHTRPKI